MSVTVKSDTHKFGDEMKHTAAQRLEDLSGLLAVTSDGEIALLRSAGSAENFVVACLVGQHLAYRAGRSDKQAMSIDDIIAAGGLAQRVARQTVYNATSALSKAKVIRKTGNEFIVDERAVLQFLSAVLPGLVRPNQESRTL